MGGGDMLNGVPSQGLFFFLFKIIATLNKNVGRRNRLLQENGGQRRRVQHVMDVCAFVCTMQARQLRTLQAKEPRRVPTSANRSTPKRVCNETRPRCTKQNGKGEKGKGRLRRRRENYILIHFIVFNSFNTRLLSSSVAETLK